jgi:hypothetical protein
LRSEPNGLEIRYNKSCLLVDEPGPHLNRDCLAFIERCVALKKEDVRILIAMTPGEWQILADLDPEERYVKSRDRLTLPLLTEEQAVQLARTDWAKALMPTLPPDWRRNPFLLELLFETAEDVCDLRKQTDELIDTTIRTSGQDRFQYVHFVFEEGLSEQQRAAIRRVARGSDDFREHPLLLECGLIDESPRISDPILNHYFREPLIIHHLSDIHFGPKSASGIDDKEDGEHGSRFAEAAGGRTVREDYLAHIQGQGESAPHAILVSGDLVETGIPEQYEAARVFLDRLTELVVDHPDLRSEDLRVALVGGNHDVDWNETRGSASARKRHLAFARYMDGYPHPHLEKPPEERELSIVVWPGVGVEIALLGSAEYGGEEDDIQEQLVHLIDEVVTRARDAFEADEMEKYEGLSKQISRLDPGLINYLDLKRLESHRWEQPLRIAVMHHPVSPMPTGAEIARFGGLINAGAVKSSYFRAQVALVLHGHQHCGWFGRESWPGSYENRELFIAAAPTLGSRETIENLGFNEIRIYREGASNYEVEIRRISYNGNGWDWRGEGMSFWLGQETPV